MGLKEEKQADFLAPLLRLSLIYVLTLVVRVCVSPAMGAAVGLTAVKLASSSETSWRSSDGTYQVFPSSRGGQGCSRPLHDEPAAGFHSATGARPELRAQQLQPGEEDPARVCVQGCTSESPRPNCMTWRSSCALA